MRKDIRFRQGLPVTSPERSLIDIAALLTLSTRQLEQALDEALGQRLTTLAKLSGRIAANPTQPGAARLEHLLDVRTTSTITKREAEARFLELIRRARLPDPQTQAKIDDVFTVDAYWPQARFAIEYDSYQWHVLKTNFDRDRRKDRALQKLNIESRRVTWQQMTTDTLELIADVAATIARRTA